MTEHITEALLWLFIMNLGIAFGAGLYEQRIILPQWFNRSPESGLVIILFERIGTFSYSIPTALKLMRAESLPESTVDTMVSQWVHLNYVRAALTLVG